MFAKHIFRAYDIRGIAFEELSVELIYKIGRVIGSLVLESGNNEINMSQDSRISSPQLGESLRNGILDSGCDVCFIGIGPTPVLYFATHHLNSNSGIMLTGSHNPKNHNGLKTIINGKGLTDKEVQNIYNRVINSDFLYGKGQYKEKNISEDYINRITSSHKLEKQLKVVIDSGNGAASEIAPKLFNKLGCDLTELHCKFDGNFPNHHPDPSRPENLKDLIKTVKDKKADIGLAFDGDADRLGVVTSEGYIIWPDRQMMLYSESILKDISGGKIVFDVKCSKYLSDVIKKNNGTPIMYKTGHSVIKKKMLEEKAVLAGEMSGHIFFKNQWYGFDDALYTAVRLLETISRSDISSDEIFKQFPDPASTPEINIKVPEEQKFNIIETLSKNLKFKDAEIITIDGIRIEFENGWGLIRASNTTPCLVTRFEADNEEELKKIQKIFKDLINEHFPEINVDF